VPEEHVLGAPTDPQTLRLLAAELAEVAARVPIVLPPAPPLPPPEPEEAPPPRPAGV